MRRLDDHGSRERDRGPVGALDATRVVVSGGVDVAPASGTALEQDQGSLLKIGLVLGRLCSPRFLTLPDVLSRKQALPDSVDMRLQGAIRHAFIAGNVNR